LTPGPLRPDERKENSARTLNAFEPAP